MKKIGIYSSVLIFTLVSLVGLQSFQQKKAAAKIKFEKVVHDYGVMVQSADGNCEFKFTNTGNDILFLTRVAKSCGCTEPTYSKEPIPPGGEASIKVGYNTELIGAFEKTITVFSNAENNMVVLKIKGEVKAKE